MAHYTQYLNQQEIAYYKSRGATDNDLQTAVDESELEKSHSQVMKMKDPRQFAKNSLFTAQYNENLIQWQLELDSILERIEHMLRGDQIKFVDKSLIWVEAKKDEEKRMNDYGVSEMMRILANYINRNTILSNYDEKTINFKLLDLGNEVADEIYLKYELMGLDTLEKRKSYPMMVRQIVDIIHSSYLRALHGGERESLREARQVTQSQPIPGVNINTGMPVRERSLVNPMRYILGRNKL